MLWDALRVSGVRIPTIPWRRGTLYGLLCWGIWRALDIRRSGGRGFLARRMSLVVLRAVVAGIFVIPRWEMLRIVLFVLVVGTSITSRRGMLRIVLLVLVSGIPIIPRRRRRVSRRPAWRGGVLVGGLFDGSAAGGCWFSSGLASSGWPPATSVLTGGAAGWCLLLSSELASSGEPPGAPAMTVTVVVVLSAGGGPLSLSSSKPTPGVMVDGRYGDKLRVLRKNPGRRLGQQQGGEHLPDEHVGG